MLFLYERPPHDARDFSKGRSTIITPSSFDLCSWLLYVALHALLEEVDIADNKLPARVLERDFLSVFEMSTRLNGNVSYSAEYDLDGGVKYVPGRH